MFLFNEKMRTYEETGEGAQETYRNLFRNFLAFFIDEFNRMRPELRIKDMLLCWLYTKNLLSLPKIPSLQDVNGEEKQILIKKGFRMQQGKLRPCAMTFKSVRQDFRILACLYYEDAYLQKALDFLKEFSKLPPQLLSPLILYSFLEVIGPRLR